MKFSIDAKENYWEVTDQGGKNIPKPWKSKITKMPMFVDLARCWTSLWWDADLVDVEQKET